MLNDKIKAKQDAFIESLKTVSVLDHLTDDGRRSVVFTIAKAFTGGKAILEVLPTPVMSPTEIRIVHEGIMEQTATIADLVYQHFVPQAYDPATPEKDTVAYGLALAELTTMIMEFATELARSVDEDNGGTSQIVLPS